MAPRSWLAIAGQSLLALAGEVGAGLVLSFSPGWANGWPFGLAIHSVWSTAMSALIGLLVLTVLAAAGAVIGAIGCYFGIGLRRGRAAYAGWLACSALLGLVAGFWVFPRIYESTLEMWPGGYNPAGR